MWLLSVTKTTLSAPRRDPQMNALVVVLEVVPPIYTVYNGTNNDFDINSTIPNGHGQIFDILIFCAQIHPLDLLSTRPKNKQVDERMGGSPIHLPQSVVYCAILCQLHYMSVLTPEPQD